MTKRPLYLNKLVSKKFVNQEEARQWAEQQKAMYKQAGQSVRITIEYGNDQMWEAKILPKVGSF